MKVPLGSGLFAFVDEADAKLIAPYRWSVQRNVRRSYAMAFSGGRKLFMHRLLLPGAEVVDHINGDSLDNRRSNLRAATKRQNAHNSAKCIAPTTSRFKGVYWHGQRGKWAAMITKLPGRRESLGLHVSERAAAEAYDNAARRLFGEFAAVNFPSRGERAA